MLKKPQIILGEELLKKWFYTTDFARVGLGYSKKALDYLVLEYSAQLEICLASTLYNLKKIREYRDALFQDLNLVGEKLDGKSISILIEFNFSL